VINIKFLRVVLLVWLVGSMGINLLPLFCMGAGPRSNELLGTWILEDDEMIYVSVMIEVMAFPWSARG